MGLTDEEIARRALARRASKPLCSRCAVNRVTTRHGFCRECTDQHDAITDHLKERTQ